MSKFVGCFVASHDHHLVTLAVVICALASFTAVELFCHAQWSNGRLRSVWLVVAAAAGGSGIWATHFIAMLAFTPRVPSGYDLGLTVLSLVYAVVLTGCGLGVALFTTLPSAAWIGGALVGGGAAAMHYTGMAAFEVAGRVEWDHRIVAASIVLGAIFGSLSVATATGRRRMSRQIPAALFLLLAICSLHFMGMGAVTIVPDPTIVIASSTLPRSWLATAVALASVVILLCAAAALSLDIHDRNQAARERERLRSLANAAVEGLLVCCGGLIASANSSFARMVGCDESMLTGASLSAFLADGTLPLAVAGPDHPIEAELRRSDGKLIPVELIMRSIDYANRPHFALAIRDLRARRIAESQIQFLALHDGLTGLANRTSFNRRLDQAMQETAAAGGKLAVLCLDLDRFKEINELCGHAVGDTRLQDFARIATGALVDLGMVSRLGGDEFAVLARIEQPVAAGRCAERILDALRVQQDADGGVPPLATSIGIAIFPDDATERTLLLNCADTALHRAKGEGRGTYRFYENRMGADVRERRLIEHDLRQAIARDQMSVFYQPQTAVETGEVFGFEALLRWRHPERGSVPPSVFIPIAEECGLILQLGEWVLRHTCHEAARWTRPLSIAVNVSALQIHGSDCAEILRGILVESGLEPCRLEIEITETALVRDPARARSTLLQIKALGVRIAMDDFGTGYSSLSNLRQFPFDKIKIDASFIKSVDQSLQAAAIVRSVLGLGRGLGLAVLAEGVETPQELAFLRAENCNEAQGYLMGRPAPIADYAAYTDGLAPPARSRGKSPRRQRPLANSGPAGAPSSLAECPAPVGA